MSNGTRRSYPSRWANLQAKYLAKKQKNRCYWCKREMTYGSRSTKPWLARTLEHILPLAAGGDHSESNLAAACHSCNQQRNNDLQAGHDPCAPPSQFHSGVLA